jgi:hypothetical protein
MVTEPGPVLALSENPESEQAKSIYKRIGISIDKHQSLGVALVAHYDCAGNPLPKEAQLEQLKKSMDAVRKVFPGVEVIGLWADENWSVEEIKTG